MNTSALPRSAMCLIIVGSMLVNFSMHGLGRLEPTNGCYFGVNIGDGDTIGHLRLRLGLSPAVYVRFFSFPLTQSSREQLVAFLNEVRPARAIALITLEPLEGLNAVNASNCLELAQLCAANEAAGIQGIMIRFAHEMNGNWYPWCQQPILFQHKFRLLARIIHTNTVRSAMVWAPNNGIGYPFSPNGAHRAVSGTPDFVALDTNGDGHLTSDDDMYEPYYPGDDAVDWVGMTVYHWGANYPWLENEMPHISAFARTLRGTASHPAIPDFYARYCGGSRNKPLAIPETAAFFNTQQPAGSGEFQIKQAWWRQVFNAFNDNTNEVNIAEQFPKLKCINWFDHYKPEGEAQTQWIDWRISENPAVRDAFVNHLRQQRQGQAYFLTAEQMECSGLADCITADNLPRILSLNGVVTVSLTAKTATNCDLVVDLLDETYRWHGGTRASVMVGTQSVTLSFPLIAPLSNGQTYRWSIFLTKRGSNYLDAIAWYDCPRPVACEAPRLRVGFHGQQLFLSWQSTSAWRYQAFETSSMTSNAWAPFGPLVIGTGSILELPIPAAAAKKFYRLEVFPP